MTYPERDKMILRDALDYLGTERVKLLRSVATDGTSRETFNQWCDFAGVRLPVAWDLLWMYFQTPEKP